VLDVHAFRAAGLQTETALAPRPAADSGGRTTLPPAWEALGIIFVPCRAAPLLTTRQQLAMWQSATGTTSLPAGIDQAVAEAANFGHDNSGRFRTVLDWLQVQNQAEPNAAQHALPGELWNPLGMGGTDWEPLAGSVDEALLVIVRNEWIPTAGIVLAVLVTVAALRWTPNSDRRRRLTILVWLAVPGLALLWLPGVLRPLAWALALAGLGMALVWELRPIRTSAIAPAATPATAALLVLVAV